ncbi:AAA family ATPase [Fibrella aquatilis]|uniref:AAA family ATPase n=1 Tax=Fibrella aquatilis TaxID=2817059 RepID=A0A939G253_9BACT|nr:AAA family ATPase [Fibrella aquatilis]MBO0930664.1 AAA family ATPase [Fibrella aquatilis]
MKITGIEIGEYRQFKNIKFDFTYPADFHDKSKAGKALEKVCFIGQSGTGKTTLLNAIEDHISVLNQALKRNTSDHIPYEELSNYSYISSSFQFQFALNQKNTIIPPHKGLGRFDPEYIEKSILNSLDKKSIDSLLETNKLCICLRESIAREADAFLADQSEAPQFFSDFVKTTTQIEREKEALKKRLRDAGDRKVISLGDMNSLSIWQYLLEDISDFDEVSLVLFNELIKNIEDPSAVAQTAQIQERIRSKENPRNKLYDNCLKSVLDNFFLEIDPNYAKVPIALQTKQGVKINGGSLSTGTRQLLATSIPIYKFDTTDTIILFDEPERSLFPDIQRQLIKHYTSLAPKAQFFFATHSPIIAASFEPEERFILHFDEEGNVKCRKGVAPIGDDPNDILSEDFGLNELMLDEGLEAYAQYRNLFVKIKNEQDQNRKNKLIAEQAHLGNKYNF